jgi:hypothetical protein
MARMKVAALAAVLLPSSALALPPLGLTTQNVKSRQSIAPTVRAQAVIDTFKLSWEGYMKYAFPNDELKPVTNGVSNSRYARSHILILQISVLLTNRKETHGAPPPSTPSPPPSS